MFAKQFFLIQSFKATSSFFENIFFLLASRVVRFGWATRYIRWGGREETTFFYFRNSLFVHGRFYGARSKIKGLGPVSTVEGKGIEVLEQL